MRAYLRLFLSENLEKKGNDIKPNHKPNSPWHNRDNLEKEGDNTPTHKPNCSWCDNL